MKKKEKYVLYIIIETIQNPPQINLIFPLV